MEPRVAMSGVTGTEQELWPWQTVWASRRPTASSRQSWDWGAWLSAGFAPSHSSFPTEDVSLNFRPNVVDGMYTWRKEWHLISTFSPCMEHVSSVSCSYTIGSKTTVPSSGTSGGFGHSGAGELCKFLAFYISLEHIAAILLHSLEY